MSSVILISLTLSILVVNSIGLALATVRLTGNYIMARAVSPLLVVLPLFLLEHFIGLGQIAWLCVPTTIISLMLIRNGVETVKTNWIVEMLFGAGFFYAFLWRFCFPDINSGSEKLTDLGFILNYLPGSKLPPVDRWFPPYSFDFYYGLQYYASALIGRVFNLDPGTTYNLSFCTLVGITVVAAGGAARRLCAHRSLWLLPVACVLLGGTGASPLMRFIRDTPQISDSMRFIGGALSFEKVTTSFGDWLVSHAYSSSHPPLELPAETFGYLAYLGDLHPPMSGFYLLALGVLCIAITESEVSPFAQAVFAATIPLTLAADAWNFPLQASLGVWWVAYRVRSRKPPAWNACGAGILLSTIMLFPFLQGFAWRSLDYAATLRFVLPGEHTPALLGFIVFYPLVGLILVRLFFRDTAKLGWWLALFVLLMLAVSEVIFVDDTYSGIFNRFNTTLKWWPWIYFLGLLGLGSLNLNLRSRTARLITTIMLVLPILFVNDLVLEFARSTKPHLGRLRGDAWIRSDPVESAILEYLRAQPQGIVLQRPAGGAFTYTPAIVMFSGQTSFLGWSGHEKLWRGDRVDVQIRETEVTKFFRGEVDDSADWLIQNHIQYVLWLKGEAGLPPASFERLNEQIGSRYYWREFYRIGDSRIGLWQRKAP